MGKITNLVFEGGGIKGLAYVGAVRELAAGGHLKTVKHMAGASAGAITAGFLGLGYSVDEVEKLMPDDLAKFKNKIPLLLTSHWGLHSGKTFYEWLSEAIQAKLNNPKATFADLHTKVLMQGDIETDTCFRDIHLMGSNLSTERGELFSYYTTPNMPLVDAIRISMSFPLFFEAKSYRKDAQGRFVFDENGSPVEDSDGDMYVDGGIAQNFPIALFDTGFANTETLGLRVDAPHEIAEQRYGKLPQAKPIKHWHQYGLAIIDTGESLQNTRGLDNFRTIFIDVGNIGTLQFELKPDEKAYLINNGKKAVQAFFAQQAIGQTVQPQIVQDFLRGQKRDREHFIDKADSVYFKANSPLLQLVFNLPVGQEPWRLEEKIAKYTDQLNRHWGILSLQHHKQVGGDQQIITISLDSALQQQVEKYLIKFPNKARHEQILDAQQDKLVSMFSRLLQLRPSWMVDPQIKPTEKAKLVELVKADEIEAVMQAIQAGVPLDARDEKGNTLLHMAAQIGSQSLVHLLLTRGLAIDAVNNFGDTPLHLAVQRQALANDPGALCVKLLCSSGAKANSKNQNNTAPLLEAAASGHIEAVNKLLTYGAHLNHQNAKGLTALMLATSQGNRAVVQRLLEVGANVDLTDKQGFTARSKAETKGNAEILALLPVSKEPLVVISSPGGEEATSSNIQTPTFSH